MKFWKFRNSKNNTATFTTQEVARSKETGNGIGNDKQATSNNLPKPRIE